MWPVVACPGTRVYAQLTGLSAHLNEVCRQIARSAIAPNLAETTRKIAGLPSMQDAVLQATGFGNALTPMLQRYAETIKLAQFAPLMTGYDEAIRRLVPEGNRQFQTSIAAAASEVLRSVDLAAGARIMDVSLQDERVEELADTLAAQALDQDLPDAITAVDPRSDVSSVQKTAVWLFIYLCGA